MIGSIYLIGGGEIRNGETIEIDNELKKIAPEKSTFVFFGTAANDNHNYINTIRTTFGDWFNVVAPTEQDGLQFAIASIQSASVIYLGGGITQSLIDYFKKGHLVEHLIAARNRGTHIAGMSAGALALSSWYVHEEDQVMELRQGWGLVPLCTFVHAQQHSALKAEEIWRDKKNIHLCSFVAIGESAAWCINSIGTKKIGSGEIWLR